MRRSITRRQVLCGTGGVAIGLPFLPSLLAGPAYGADPVFAGPKRFVCIGSPHGAVLPESRDPTAAMANLSSTLFPGHDIRYGRLAPTMNGSSTALSPVLSAPSAMFTPALIAKMNVLRGFDIPWYIAHNTGGYLGNFARSDAEHAGVAATATIDQLMAWSPRFYADPNAVRQRSIVTGFDFRGMSWSFSNPQARSGSIDKVPVIHDSGELFDRLFAGNMPNTPDPPPVARRRPVVDALLANYRSLRQSNTRLSSGDKQRLDDHIAKLAEVERRVKGSSGLLEPNCTASKPSDNAAIVDEAYVSLSESKHRFGLLVDVVAMALACDASRIATISQLYPYSDYKGDWHQDVAHKASQADSQALLVQSSQAQFESIVLSLAAKLDATEEAPGHTVLDSTLLFWGQESGWSTHDSQDMTLVTFGGANGFFKTGNYVDYRNLSPNCVMGSGTQTRQLGLNYRQFLANCLLSMGLPRSEFEAGAPGYGDPYADGDYAKMVAPGVVSRQSDPLPIVTA